MKRLPLVAIGVALCAFATSAEAQSGRMGLGAHDGYGSYADGGDWDSDYVRLRAPAERAAERRARRYGARSGRRSRMVERRPVNARGFVIFSRSAGTSRTCLAPAARDLLARIEAQFGAVGIISTCRPGARIAGSGRPSRHASGHAIDFNAPAGRKADMVRWLIANHRSGGVMTYSDMGHIHVDIGHRFVALGSPSGGRRRWR
jgi:hypothetical protein